MFKRMLGSRGFLSFGLIVLLAAVASIGFQVARPMPKMRSYCALMPDSIGLFEGSPVSILGIAEGRITRVLPEGDKARVEFDLPADRKLAPDAGAATVSDTLIADRRLAIIGTAPTGPSWEPTRCITKTVTPKSLTQTFAAIGDLADQLNGADDPSHRNLIIGGLQALDTATDGTAASVNELIHKLGSALNSPDAAIGHLGATIDALATLLRSAENNWEEIELAVTRMSEALFDIAERSLPQIIASVDKLQDLLPALNDLTIMFGGPLLRRLDAVENLPQMLSAGVAELRAVVQMAPAIAGAFTGAVDPETQRISLAYAPPRVAISEPDAARVCAAINAITPGGCTADPSNGLVNIQAAQLVFGSVGAR
ncbi:MlaD family protein [Nocardia sp. NPDC050713]|uniref:MlaD family protein n=1 Tax=Nocardia sp. NPDC050713 TaxID=3154511 RepID=UPI0033FC6BE6